MSEVLKRFTTAKDVIRALMLDRGETDVNNYQKYMHYFSRAFDSLQLRGYIPNLKRVMLTVNADKTADLPEDFLQYYSAGVWMDGSNEMYPLTKNRELVPKPSGDINGECCCEECGCKDDLCSAIRYPTTTTEDILMTLPQSEKPTCDYQINVNWAHQKCSYQFVFSEPFAGVYPFSMEVFKNGASCFYTPVIANSGDIDSAFVGLGFTVSAPFTYDIVDSYDVWNTVVFDNGAGNETIPASASACSIDITTDLVITYPFTIDNIYTNGVPVSYGQLIQGDSDLVSFFTGLGFTETGPSQYSISATDTFNFMNITDWDDNSFSVMFAQTGCICETIQQTFKKTTKICTKDSGSIVMEVTEPIITQGQDENIFDCYLDLTAFNMQSHNTFFPFAFTAFTITELFYDGQSHVVSEFITSYAELRTYLESLGFTYVNNNLYTIIGGSVNWSYLYTGKIYFNVATFIPTCKNWSVDYDTRTSLVCKAKVKDCGCIEVTPAVVESCGACGVRSLWWWWDRYMSIYAQYSLMHRRTLNLNSNPYGYYNVLENEGTRGLVVLNPDFGFTEVMLVYQAKFDVNDVDFMIPLQAKEMFVSCMHAKSIEKRSDISLYERREAERIFKRDAAEARRLINPLRLYELLDSFRTNPTG